MLRELRRSAKTLPVKIALAVLVGSFTVWGIGDIFSFRLDSNVATVGDTGISAQEYSDALQRTQRRLTQQLRKVVTYDQMRAAGMDRSILAGLMRQAAFKEELKRLELSASDQAVAAAIRADPAFQDASGKFSQASYETLLAQQGISRVSYEDQRRFDLAQGVLSESATAAVRAPAGVGPRIAAWQGETRKGATLTLPLSMAPDPGTPDQKALQAFYDAHHPMFTEPERRGGEYIHVNAAELLKTLRPDDAALKKQYEATKTSFATEATRQVDQITYPDHAAAEKAQSKLLSGGVTFDMLAKDAGVKPDELSLGTVSPGDLPAAASKAVFGLDKPGIVGPVDLPAGGAAIYRVDKITPAGTKPFDEVKDQIAKQMAEQALQYRAPELANKVEDLRAQGLTFPQIAEKAGPGVDYGKFSGLARDGGLPDGKTAKGVLDTPTFLKEAFAALDAEERDLVETPQHGYILVMIDNITDSALQPLDKVHDKAVAAWQLQQKRKALLAKGKDLAKRLGKDASIYDIGTEIGIKPEVLPPFTQLSMPQALPHSLAEDLTKVPLAGGAAGMSKDDNSVIVAQISEITPLDKKEVTANASAIDDVLQRSLKGDVAEYYARAVEDLHPGTVSNGVVEKVFERLGGSAPVTQ